MDSLLVSILTGAHVLIAIGLITLILLQQGPGAGMGAAFGSGASGTVFGSRGSASFLTKTTAILATVFFVNSITLAYLASNRPTEDVSVLERVQGPQVERPAVPVEPADERPGADDVPQLPRGGAQGEDAPAGDRSAGFRDDMPATPGETGGASGQAADVPSVPQAPRPATD